MSQDLLAFRPIRPFKFDVSVNAAAGELNHHCVLFRDNGSFKNFENHMVADMYSDAVRNVRYSGLYSVLSRSGSQVVSPSERTCLFLSYPVMSIMD